MKIKTILIASALFFSFQASAVSSACAAAQRAENVAEQNLDRLWDNYPETTTRQELRDATGVLGMARATRILACEFGGIGEI